MSINRVTCTGNLGSDPEMRRTQSGTAVMSFSLAVNERRRSSQTGEWEDCCNWVDCTMFGTRAEAVSNYLRKGSKVGVDGHLRHSSWERDGQKRSKLEVIVDDLELLTPKQDGQAPNYVAKATFEEAPAALEPSVYEDDIPFGG